MSFYLCLLQDWDRQNPTQIITELCGFVTILSGTFLLHKTKDMVDGMLLYFFIHNNVCIKIKICELDFCILVSNYVDHGQILII